MKHFLYQRCLLHSYSCSNLVKFVIFTKSIYLGVSPAATNAMVTSTSTNDMPSVGFKDTTTEANSTAALNTLDTSLDIHTLPSSTSTTQTTVTYTDEESSNDLVDTVASTLSSNIHTPGLQTVFTTKATETISTAQTERYFVSSSIQDTSNHFVSAVTPRSTSAYVVIDTSPVLSTVAATNAFSEHSMTPTSDQGSATFTLDYEDTGTSHSFTTPGGEVNTIPRIDITLVSSTPPDNSDVFEDTYSITSTPSKYYFSTSIAPHGLTTLGGIISTHAQPYTSAASTTLHDISTGFEDTGSGTNTPDSRSDFSTSGASHEFTTLDREFSISTPTETTAAPSNVQDASTDYGASPTAIPSATAFQFEPSTPSTPHGSATSHPSVVLINTHPISFTVPDTSADSRNPVESTSISSRPDFPTSSMHESTSELLNHQMTSTSAATSPYEPHTSNFEVSSISLTTDSLSEASTTKSSVPSTSKQSTVDNIEFTATQVPGTTGTPIQTFSVFTNSNSFTEIYTVSESGSGSTVSESGTGSTISESGSGFTTVFEDTAATTAETTFHPFTGEIPTVPTLTETDTAPAAVETSTVRKTTNFDLNTDITSSSVTPTVQSHVNDTSTSLQNLTSDTNDITTIEGSTSGSAATSFPANQSNSTTNFVTTSAPALDENESSTQSTMTTSTVYASDSVLMFSKSLIITHLCLSKYNAA